MKNVDLEYFVTVLGFFLNYWFRFVFVGVIMYSCTLAITYGSDYFSWHIILCSFGVKNSKIMSTFHYFSNFSVRSLDGGIDNDVHRRRILEPTHVLQNEEHCTRRSDRRRHDFHNNRECADVLLLHVWFPFVHNAWIYRQARIT